MEGQGAGKSSVSRLKMSVQKVLFVALLCLLVTVAWSWPSQALNVTGTTSRKREIVKSFVAEVNALIAKLIRQLQELTAIKS